MVTGARELLFMEGDHLLDTADELEGENLEGLFELSLGELHEGVGEDMNVNYMF